jgi:hypothetical protein
MGGRDYILLRADDNRSWFGVIPPNAIGKADDCEVNFPEEAGWPFFLTRMQPKGLVTQSM